MLIRVTVAVAASWLPVGNDTRGYTAEHYNTRDMLYLLQELVARAITKVDQQVTEPEMVDIIVTALHERSVNVPVWVIEIGKPNTLGIDEQANAQRRLEVAYIVGQEIAAAVAKKGTRTIPFNIECVRRDASGLSFAPQGRILKSWGQA